jgi:hypothetical protein
VRVGKIMAMSVASQRAGKALPVAGDDKATNGRKYEKMMVPVAAQEAGEMPPGNGCRGTPCGD